MRYLFLYIFMMCSGMMYSQSYSMGNASNWNDVKYPTSCDLQLQEDNKYCISFIIQASPDLIHGLIVSYGSFVKKNNQYYLQDIPSGATIILEEAKHANLFVKKGFCFMENEYFFKTRDTVDANGIDFEYKGKKKDGQEAFFKTSKSIDTFSLQLGVYRNRGISLSLELDYRFQIFLLDNDLSFLVSEGKWSKNGNKLELHDNCLDYSFLALVEADKLIMIRFPNGLPFDENYSLFRSEIYPFIVK